MNHSPEVSRTSWNAGGESDRIDAGIDVICFGEFMEANPDNSGSAPPAWAGAIWALMIPLSLAVSCGIRSGADVRRDTTHPFQYGVSLSTHVGAYSNAGRPATLRELQRHHVGWIQVVPFAFQLDPKEPQISFRDLTSTQVHFIDAVHKAGMHVMMKPHVWSSKFWGENASWRGEIAMGSDADWNLWFQNYEKFILHYARLSEQTGVEVFTIGLEYVRATRERPGDWRKLIRKVRAVYSGPITYAAHYLQEIEQIGFWDELDFIGVILYPELSGKRDPTMADLLEGWKPVKETLRRISETHGKPVVVAEIGFNSIVGAAEKPWEWARRGARVDLEIQARCYEATFQALWEESWLGGIYFWKWRISGKDGGPENIHYTPQGKPAALVMQKWFGKIDAAPDGSDPGSGQAGAR